MSKKLYSISELINENIRLKKKLEKIEKDNLRKIINLLNLIFPEPISPCFEFKGLSITKLKKGFKQELLRLEDGN